MHLKHDITDFRNKVTYYINNPQALKKISEEGKQLIRNYYTHEMVAKRLAVQLETAYITGKKPETILQAS